jgi:hypothetical protein
MLNQAMQTLVKNHSMGYYATVSPDGMPCVAPKGMSLVLDDNTLMFGEVRSPGTLQNLRHNPNVEVNFLDVLQRKALRARGQAEILDAGSSAFVQLHPNFSQWGDLAGRIKHIVKINLTQAKLITSPAYDLGADEEELEKHWKAHYANL